MSFLYNIINEKNISRRVAEALSEAFIFAFIATWGEIISFEKPQSCEEKILLLSVSA